MRLHVLCDLHLEFGPVEIPATNADVVVLAGDMHVGTKGCAWALHQFPNTPVVYVLGNHEFYHNSLPALTETMKRDTAGTNVHVLENNSVENDGYRFVGCTLWTDFMVGPNPTDAMRTAEAMMNDFRLITNSTEERALRASDTVKLHKASLAWLKDELAKGDPSRTIVVTHHAPSHKSEAPYYKGSALNPAFTSDLDYLVERSGVPLWVHGHTHYNVDYKLGVTRVLTNQRGYPNQASRGFDPGLVVDV